LLSHISPRDKRIHYEAEEKAKITGFPTTKELRQVREAALNRLKREEGEAEKVGLVSRPLRIGYAALRLIWSIAEIQESSLFKALQGRQCFTHHCVIVYLFSSGSRFLTTMSLM
jgi:hypothetical protein